MGKYLLDGLLGPGGVTETYLARAETKPQPGTPVELFALKLLRADRVPEGWFAEAAARFLSAGRQLRDFHRPGFGKVLDVSGDPSATFMVGEYLPGCDLGRLLEACRAEGKAGVHPVLAGLIGSEVARLLDVGHSAKPAFAHLGLCPQNVIIGASGEVTLLDAGIAASLRGITEQPPERWALVAPEIRATDTGAIPLAEPAAVAADLYSLGALLFLLLAGRAPDPAAVEIPEVPGMTGKLAAALRTLLAREPDDRPGDAAMLVEWLAGEGVEVRERRRLIAEGVHASEKGVRVSSQSLPAASSEPARQPPAVLTSQQGAKSVGRSAVWPRSWRTLGVPALLAAGLACAAALLVGRVQSRGSPEFAARGGEVEHRSQDVERPRPAGPAGGGETPGKTRGDQAEAPVQAGGSLLARVAGHLIVETVPPGAMVWVDGALKGKTFADIVVGDGRHGVVVIAPGHRMFREVIDTSNGAIIRRNLPELPPPTRGTGFVDVSCRTPDRFPILLDDEETGLLCPVKMLPTSSGKHSVGIFVPRERRALSVEAMVEAGSRPAAVTFGE